MTLQQAGFRSKTSHYHDHDVGNSRAMVTTRRRARLSEADGDVRMGEASAGSSKIAQKLAASPNKEASPRKRPRTSRDAKIAGEDRSQPGTALLNIGIKTSEDLIRTLKARASVQNDQLGSLEGVDIAATAWSDQQVQIPRKAELLLGWALDELAREAKATERGHTGKGKQVGKSALSDVRYWQLAETLMAAMSRDTLQRTIAKQPLDSILFAAGSAIQDDTSQQGSALPEDATRLAIVGNALRSLFNAQAGARSTASLETALGGLGAWLRLGSAILASSMPSQANDVDLRLVTSLAMVIQAAVKLWLRQLGRQAAISRSRDYFLDTMLGPFAQVVAWLGEASANVKSQDSGETAAATIALLCSSLLRFTMECFYATVDQAADATKPLIAALHDQPASEWKWRIVPTFLAQRCSTLKKQISQTGVTLQQQAEARRQTVMDTAAPLIEYLSQANEGQGATLPDTLARLNSLCEALDISNRSNLDLTASASHGSSCFIAAQDYILSSSAQASTSDAAQITAAVRCVTALHELDQTSLSPQQWAIVAKALLRQKTTPEATDLLRRVSDSAARRRMLYDMASWLFEATRATSADDYGHGAVSSSLFDLGLWENHLGVSLRTFVSERQAIKILELAKDETAKGETTQSTLYLAAQIISYIAIPRPVEGEAIALLQQLYDDLEHRLIGPALVQGSHADVQEIATAALSVSQAITSRVLRLGGVAKPLLQHIDANQDSQIQLIRDNLVSKNESMSSTASARLNIALYMRTLDRISRDDQAGTTSHTAQMLKDRSTVEIVMAAAKRTASVSTLLQLIGTSHLLVFDRHASDDVLRVVARTAMQRFSRPSAGQGSSSFASLFTSAGSLELLRWRKIIGEVMLKSLEVSSPVESIALLAALDDGVELPFGSSDLAIFVQHSCVALADLLEASISTSEVSDSEAAAALRVVCTLISDSSITLKLPDVLASHVDAFTKASASEHSALINALLQAMLHNIAKHNFSEASEIASRLLQRIETTPAVRDTQELVTMLEQFVGTESRVIAHNGAKSSVDTAKLHDKAEIVQEHDASTELMDVKAMEEMRRLQDKDTTAFCMDLLERLVQATKSSTLPDGFDALKVAAERSTEMIAELGIHPHHIAASLAHISTYSHLQNYTDAIERLTRSVASSKIKSFGHWRAELQVLCLVLCNGPEGSLPASQAAALRLLSSLPARLVDPTSDMSNLAEIVADTLEALVLGRMLLFKQREAGACLAVMTAILSPRSDIATSSGKTGHSIFTSLTISLTHLVRLRPDALSPLLPQLTVVLTQLLGLFREPMAAPTPGAGQAHEHVAYSTLLPPWLNVRNAPLDVTHARQLSRLFSALTARSSTKVRQSFADRADRRRDTLAKPFSSHAVYVLLAYIRDLTKLDDVLSGPVCLGVEVDDTPRPHAFAETVFARGETGEELARAMYSVCDVISTHQRNLLMDFLADDGERVVARRLLRAHESQRYKG